MNILMTGANGFIGSHLTERLLRQGHTVTCFVRPTSNLRWIRHLPVLYRYDFEDLGHYDVVYHIAGQLGQKKLALDVYREVHIEMTKRILRGMNSHQELVYMSSAWAYYPKKPYEYTKLEGERVIQSSNIPYTIIRPGFVIGPRDFHHLPLYQYISRLGRFFPIVGDGKNKVCPTYISDVVDMLAEARNSRGVVPIAGKSVTMNEFIWAVADATGASRPFIHIPFGPRHDFFTTERIFPTVTNNTTPLEVGLKEAVEWYRQNNLLKKEIRS